MTSDAGRHHCQESVRMTGYHYCQSHFITVNNFVSLRRWPSVQEHHCVMSHWLSHVPPVSHHPLNDLFHSVTTVTSLLFTSVHITLGNLEFVLTFHNKVTVNNHFQQSQYSIFLTLHSTKFCHSVGVISGYISMSKETGHTRQRLRSYLMSSCGVLPDV